MNEEHIKALLLLSGIEAETLFKLPNRYWPEHEDYAEIRRNSPWWLVKTPAGLIEIGWRKRVISIDWSNTGLRRAITEDNVTKDFTMVHAWSYAKAVEYLADLNQALKRMPPEPPASGNIELTLEQQASPS